MGLYIKTARENAQALLRAVSLLIQASTSQSLLEEIHRNAHTLKGKSLVMGYPKTASLAKKIEDLFFAVLRDRHSLTAEEIEHVRSAAEKLQRSVEHIEKNGQELDLTPEINGFSP